jgi:hypothetical protein
MKPISFFAKLLRICTRSGLRKTVNPRLMAELKAAELDEQFRARMEALK